MFEVDITKTITPPSPTPDNSFGTKVLFAVECTDGVDVQIREGDVNAAVAKKGAAYTTAQAVNATNAITGGTLTVTFSWITAGNIATLQVTAMSSLVPTDLHIHYFLLYATHDAFTYV